MKKLWLLSFLAIPFLVAHSQAPLHAGFEHWTAADLQVVNKTLAAKAARRLASRSFDSSFRLFE